MNPVRHIPNAITCSSLVCGCAAIVMSFYMRIDPCALSVATWLIAISAVCDFCDGLAARTLHAYSDLGKQLDSLSDLVSFGVAPAMLVFNMMNTYGAGPWWLPWTALLIPVCGELRLAKFNIDDTQTSEFAGMPIPACAIFWIGMCWLPALSPDVAGGWLWPALIVASSLLMVSFKLRMFSLKIKSLKSKENTPRYFLIGASVAAIILQGVGGLAIAIAFYVVIALLLNLRKKAS